MILQKGSKGKKVEELQAFLKIKVDGDFGAKTEIAVMKFQLDNGLLADGIVGRKTWEKLTLLSSDVSERAITTFGGLVIVPKFMDKDEYIHADKPKNFVFLHHTGGWHNPYDAIQGWNDDNRGRIGTEFVIGGESISGNDNSHDGETVQAFPEGNWAYHLGNIGSSDVHSGSVGVELCNFGQLQNGRAWQGSKVAESQIYTFKTPFRGFAQYHRYSDDQLKNSKKLLKFIADRDNIDIRKGLPELVKKNGAKAFEFNKDAYYGRVKGLWSHVNTRKDKFDCSPQEDLLTMLMEL